MVVIRGSVPAIPRKNRSTNSSVLVRFMIGSDVHLLTSIGPQDVDLAESRLDLLGSRLVPLNIPCIELDKMNLGCVCGAINELLDGRSVLDVPYTGDDGVVGV